MAAYSLSRLLLTPVFFTQRASRFLSPLSPFIRSPLFDYRKYPGRAPKGLLNKFGRGGKNEAIFIHRPPYIPPKGLIYP